MALKRIAITGPVNAAAVVPMPPDFNPFANKVRVLAGGGSGGLNGGSDGGGGGGGGYSEEDNVPVYPGQLVPFYVGAGGLAATVNGPGHAGGASCFNGTSLASCSVGAAGGGAGAQSNHGGLGGDAAAGIGSLKTSGGAGGDAGGGGGAGGANGDGLGGHNASPQYGGAGDAGMGGAGATSSAAIDGGAGAEFTATMLWNGLAWSTGTFVLGSGGGGWGAGVGSGGGQHGGGAGGLYGGGAGGRDNSGALHPGGQGYIILEYDPIAAPTMADF